MAVRALNASLDQSDHGAERAILGAIMLTNLEFLLAGAPSHDSRSVIDLHLRFGLKVLQGVRRRVSQPKMLPSWESLDDSMQGMLAQVQWMNDNGGSFIPGVNS